MNYKMIGRFLGQILSIEGLFMIPAALISVGYGEWNTVLAFLITMGAITGTCLLIFLTCHKAPKILNAREGMICVGFSWIVLSLFGCLPFVLSGDIPRYIDAFFEIVSGFTTTGASILSNVEDLSKGVLYWRSFSHWLGGMGVLVFLLAVSPGDKDTGFTMHLLRAESPGPEVGKLTPRMRKTASILYIIYIALTIINIIFLLCGGMHWLEAICTAFGTAGTGGFGIKNDSIGSFSPYIQYVTTVFMFLFGINFSCYYLLLLRQFRSVFRDEELRTYIAIVVVAIVLIVLNIRHMYSTLEETFRHASFTVSSIVTTTGYCTTDFDQWPAFSKSIIMFLMMVGACAGSTGGGLKVSRLLYLLKSLGRNITQVLNPRRVKAIRNNGSVVSQQVLDNTNAYLAAYVSILVFSFVIVSLDNNTIGTNFTAVLSCFNNIGPGLEAVGPTCNFAHYSNLSKLVLSADMLAGRLEIFPILALFARGTWKH
ncbi:MAG: TrkH family potassium uptake protein [Ruminococcaceae bacterium]|nr:TrkH family potassium uptake protein [Oscillospiraceae bacterium]